jgi:hypothetical protein
MTRAARDQVTQSASAAQKSLVSFEANLRPKIQQSPWAAVAIAGFRWMAVLQDELSLMDYLLNI